MKIFTTLKWNSLFLSAFCSLFLFLILSTFLSNRIWNTMLIHVSNFNLFCCFWRLIRFLSLSLSKTDSIERLMCGANVQTLNVSENRCDAYEISLFNNRVHLLLAYLFFRWGDFTRNTMLLRYLSSFKVPFGGVGSWWCPKTKLIFIQHSANAFWLREETTIRKHVKQKSTHCGIMLGHFMSIKRSQSVILIRNICSSPFQDYVFSVVVFFSSVVSHVSTTMFLERMILIAPILLACTLNFSSLTLNDWTEWGFCLWVSKHEHDDLYFVAFLFPDLVYKTAHNDITCSVGEHECIDKYGAMDTVSVFFPSSNGSASLVCLPDFVDKQLWLIGWIFLALQKVTGEEAWRSSNSSHISKYSIRHWMYRIWKLPRTHVNIFTYGYTYGYLFNFKFLFEKLMRSKLF